MTLLENGLRELSKGGQAVETWLDRRPEAATAAFAEEAKQYAHSAAQRGDGDLALAAYMLAGYAYARLGDRHGLLTIRLNQIEILFVAAQSTDTYEELYKNALDVAEKAAGAGNNTARSWAVGLAADSAYWGSEAAPNDQLRRKWIRAALRTLLDFDTLPRTVLPSGVELRFVSGLVAVFQTISGIEWGSEQRQVDADLRRLAAVAEHLIPATYEIPGDPQKSSHVAFHLARLSREYGNARISELRLKRFEQVKNDTWR